MANSQSSAPLLVAVDASMESLAALEWAVEFASTRGHHLRIVTSASPRVAPTSDSAGSYHAVTNHAEQRARDRVLPLILGPLKRSGLTFEHIVAVGPIDRVMARHSKDAVVAVFGTSDTIGWRQLTRRAAIRRLTGRLDCPLVVITAPSGQRRPSAQSPLAKRVIAAPLLTASSQLIDA